MQLLIRKTENGLYKEGAVVSIQNDKHVFNETDLKNHFVLRVDGTKADWIDTAQDVDGQFSKRVSATYLDDGKQGREITEKTKTALFVDETR